MTTYRTPTPPHPIPGVRETHDLDAWHRAKVKKYNPDKGEVDVIIPNLYGNRRIIKEIKPVITRKEDIDRIEAVDIDEFVWVFYDSGDTRYPLKWYPRIQTNPVGEIWLAASEACIPPKVACKADGRLISVKKHKILFNKIGYSFGGSGSMFAVPNMYVMHVYHNCGDHTHTEYYLPNIPPGTVWAVWIK